MVEGGGSGWRPIFPTSRGSRGPGWNPCQPDIGHPEHGLKVQLGLTNGLRIKVARTGKDGNLRTLKERFSSSALKASTTRVVAADANRDGREDLLLIIGGDGRTKIDRLQGQTKGGFKRIRIWRAPADDPGSRSRRGSRWSWAGRRAAISSTTR